MAICLDGEDIDGQGLKIIGDLCKLGKTWQTVGVFFSHDQILLLKESLDDDECKTFLREFRLALFSLDSTKFHPIFL